MTPIERMNKMMEGLSWDEAEEVGIEILARCAAMHVYAKKEEEDYIVNLSMSLTERICRRADGWAHEGDNSWYLALVATGFELRKRKENPNEEH